MSSQKNVFITGCSTGLGRATALKLIEAGHRVCATVRSLRDKEALQDACKARHELVVVILDLAEDASIDRAIAEVLASFETIDVVIHNAAAVLLGTMDSTTTDEFNYLFRVNVLAPVKITQLLLPRMRERGSGLLIFIGSISGIESSGYLGAYAATKFALEAVAGSWATTLHKWGIKTTIIEPGAMNTSLPENIPIGSYYGDSEADPYSTFHRNVRTFLQACLKTGSDPGEIADLILQIIDTENPPLRNQTCAFSRSIAEKHRRDPKGNQWVKEHRDFLEQFYVPDLPGSIDV